MGIKNSKKQDEQIKNENVSHKENKKQQLKELRKK